MPITLKDLRRYAVTRSLFAPTTLAKAVARLGFVQADPIAAPARAQDLILRHRVQGYRAGDLQRRYPRLALEEDHIHVYGYMPRRVQALLHPRSLKWDVEDEYPGLTQQVLEVVRAQGETDHRELEKALGKMHTRSGWGGRAKATTRVLEALHFRGQVRIARRAGNLRRYALAAQPRRPLAEEQRLRRMIMLLAGLYAPVAEVTLRYLVTMLGYTFTSLPARRAALAALVQSGELARAEVEGVTYYWPGGDAPGAAPTAPDEVRWLAPFDPVVWDRPRFEHLWGWPYRFEAYTKPAKRQWGYYALPMLWRDQVIGWATTAQAGGQLRVSLGYVDGQPTGRAFKRALEAERARLERSFGGEVVVGKE